MSEELIKRLRLKAEVLAGLRDATASLLTQAADALSRPAPAVQVPEDKEAALLHIDGLLADYHSAVYEAGADEDGKIDYDMAGVEIAKELRAAIAALAAPMTAPTPEQVADELGMGSGAWDMVQPEAIIAAVLKLAAAPAPAPVATEAAARPELWRKKGDRNFITHVRPVNPDEFDAFCRVDAVAQGGGVDAARSLLAEILAEADDFTKRTGKPVNGWPEKIRALLSTATPVSEGGWLPIETAPKDGTPVMLLYKGCIVEAVWECVDSGDWEHGYGPSYWWDSDLVMMDDGTEPTHWMPRAALPAAPAIAKQEKGHAD